MHTKLVLFSVLGMFLVASALSTNVHAQPTIPGFENLVTTVRTNSSYSIGYYGLGQVACKNDETLTGGGYYSSQFREMLSVFQNGPSDDGTKWSVAMMYSSLHFYGPPPSFTVYAMCAKIVP